MQDSLDIDKLQRGDRQAFRALFDAYQDRVYGTIQLLVRRREDSEDLTQEVFVEIYRSLPGFRGDSSLSTWIYRIAVNRALNHLKKRKSGIFRLFKTADSGHAEEPALREIADPGPGPDGKMQQRELSALLERALAALPERQRAAFILHKIEGLPQQEIARILDTSVSSVESLIVRAKRGLQDGLEKEDCKL